MKGLVSVLLASIVLLVGPQTSMAMDSKALSTAINKFSGAFAREVDSGNSTVSSPLSAELVLALVALGSSGKSQQEILSVLGLPNEETIRSGFKTVSDALKSVKGVEFKSANKLYVMQGGYELKSSFRDDAVNVFNAEVEKINFAESAKAASAINAWVESHTNNKIKDLISPNSLDALTRMVLINALYFKGTWQKKFSPESTRDRPFHVTSTKTVNVPFMHQTASFRYGVSEELDSKLLELPYQGRQASLVIVLPNSVDGLTGLLDKLANSTHLEEALQKMYNSEVEVAIPKFKIETEIDLKDLLEKLGVKGIFDQNNNDIDKMLEPAERLYVSKAVQKAFIEVNEEGAEAAAASAFGMMLLSASFAPESVEFVADRPCLAVLNIGATSVFTAVLRDNFTI